MQLCVGTVVEGKVSKITGFGAFVDIDGGGSGMVHISEVANTYVKDINDHLKVGDAVKAKVVAINENNKIALSIKRTQPAPERGHRPQGGGNGGPRPNQPRQKREEKPRVWQPKPQAPQGEMSFEDMMARYKSRSEEKIADLKRVTENHRGGYSRRRG